MHPTLKGCSRNDNSGLAKLRWGLLGAGVEGVEETSQEERGPPGQEWRGAAWVFQQGRTPGSRGGRSVRARQQRHTCASTTPHAAQTASFTPQRRRRDKHPHWTGEVAVACAGHRDRRGDTRAHTSSAAAGRWAPADLCGVPPLDASPACSARGRPYLPLHDGLQQGQHRMPSLGRPLWLQQVRDSLPECFHCMLPSREGMAIGVLAPQLRGQSHGHRTEQNNMLF